MPGFTKGSGTGNGTTIDASTGQPIDVVATVGSTSTTRSSGSTSVVVSGASTIPGAVDSSGGLVPLVQGGGTKVAAPAVAPITPIKTSILDIEGPTTFTLPPQSQIVTGENAGLRLGNWTEGLGGEVLQILSPGARSIQNMSGQGFDVIGGTIDTVNKTIPAFEIKGTDSSNRQPVPALDVRMDDWIREAASTGAINGKPLSPSDAAYARYIADLLDKGYTIKPYVVEVAVPGQGKSAVPTVVVSPWPRPTPMPRPKPAPFGKLHIGQ